MDISSFINGWSCVGHSDKVNGVPKMPIIDLVEWSMAWLDTLRMARDTEAKYARGGSERRR